MGGLTNMLVGAAGAQPSSALAGLSPEAQAALQQMNGPSGVPTPPPGQTMPGEAPPPAQTQPAQGGGGFMDMLTNAFTNALAAILPSTASQATAPAPPPIQSSGAGDAAIAAQKKREGQQ